MNLSKLTDKARASLERIVEAFERGDVAKLCALATYPPADMPSCNWTMRNRWMAALQTGDVDCRGFRQWKAVDRSVKKGQIAAYIIVPLIGKRKDEETDEERTTPYGYKGMPVFASFQTEGEPLDYQNQPLPDLPLLGVAHAWGLDVNTSHGGTGYLGQYRHGESITLCSPEQIVFLHELVHAADDRAGNIKKSKGQSLHNEAVAQLGAEVLRQMLGSDDKDTTGMTYAYIKSYADEEELDVISVCMDVLGRTATAIALILEAAELETLHAAAFEHAA